MGTRWAYIVLFSGLALVACGEDGSESTNPSPASAAQTNVAPTSAGTPEGTTQPTAAAATVPATTDVRESSPATAPPSTGASSCSVTITGDVSAEWTSDASGFQAFVYGGWLSNPSPDDANAFGLNCYDSDFNIVGFVSSPGAEIPMRPATYELTDSFDPDAPINADIALLFDEGLWETTSGTLEILTFDDGQIRGRFSLAIHDSFDPTRTAEVVGEFAHSR